MEKINIKEDECKSKIIEKLVRIHKVPDTVDGAVSAGIHWRIGYEMYSSVKLGNLDLELAILQGLPYTKSLNK